MAKLTKTFIDKIDKSEKTTHWDDELKGFGLRVQEKSMSWVIMYRTRENRQRMLTIGRANILAPDKAREMAKLKLAEVIQGEDPATEKLEDRRRMNLSELCELYMSEGTAHKKASTLTIDKGRIERHIKPLIGNLSITSIDTGTIEKMMLDIINGNKISIEKKSGKKRGVSRVTGGKEAANRTIQLLSAIFNFAIRRNLLDKNPAKGIQRPKANKNTEFLNIDDIKKLGEILRDEKNQINLLPIQATKLLLFTGCRRNEILSLKWKEVDLKNQCFRFSDTKTGNQIRPFGISALNLLKEIEKTKASEWVFPATRGDGHYIGLPKAFSKMTDTEDFKDREISLHTLRHSFASVGADMGFNEFTIAGLLGHRLRGVTNRYSHNVDSSLINAANKISLCIERALNGKNETTAKIININRGIA